VQREAFPWDSAPGYLPRDRDQRLRIGLGLMRIQEALLTVKILAATGAAITLVLAPKTLVTGPDSPLPSAQRPPNPAGNSGAAFAKASLGLFPPQPKGNSSMTLADIIGVPGVKEIEVAGSLRFQF